MNKKFRRTLAGLTAFLMAFSAAAIPQIADNIGVSVVASAESTANYVGLERVDNLLYDLYDDGTAYVSSYQNSNLNGAISIPATITVEGKNYSVTAINECAFRNSAGITSITLPDSVTSIGNQAFEGCTGLTSVNIPQNVTSIGSSAFEDCSKLTSITIPEGITCIDYATFRGCSSLSSISIPASVETVKNFAFDYCTNLTSISVDENNANFSSEDDILFNKDKTELILYPAKKAGSSYTIPASVTSILRGAFAYCSNLTSITVAEDNTAFSSDNGVLYEKVNSNEYRSLVAYPSGKTDTSYEVQSSARELEMYAFAGNKNLTSITISSNIYYIGLSAFAGCSGLTSINIPASVTFIRINNGQFPKVTLFR